MNKPDMESPAKDEQHEKLGTQENGVSEESLATPKRRSCVDEDPNNLTVDSNSTINSTINSECNITVIHVNGDGSTGGGGTLISEPDDEGNTPNTLDKKDYAAEGKDSKDGSDSGVEGCAVEPPRVQSRNSVDYASSCNGLDEASCDSSLVSCCSVYEDPCASLAEDMPQPANDSQPNGGEGTSEAGSESSSVAGCTSSAHKHKRPNATTTQPKKKLTLTDSVKSGSQKTAKATSATVNGTTSTGARAKPKTTNQRNTLTKSQSVSRDRGRTRDKSVAKDSTTRDSSTTGTSRSSTATASTVASRSRTRPDSLPSALTTEINKDLALRGRAAATTRPRGGSTTRTSTTTTRTPLSTPSEDGRKSLSTVGRSSSLYSRAEPRNTRIMDKMTLSMDGSKALDTYGTLPRSARLSNKFSLPKNSEKPPVASRSRSGSRDASLNRLMARKATTNSKESTAAQKGLPPHPKQKSVERTRIYHETSVQTGLTGKDIEKCLAGVATILPNPESAERTEGTSQTEGSWDDLLQLKGDLKKVTDENEDRKKENDKLKAELEDLRKRLEEEKADHAFARQELDRNAQRVLAMLGTPQSEHAGGSDSFLELETHIQSSGQVVANQQVEITDLQSLCRMLSRDLEKSLAAQKALLQQQQELEAESMEMQDFLQEEKDTLEIALKESETESKKKDDNIKQLSSELETQTEECKHLVRISEQRRQENLSLSMKLNALERRSRELLLAQGAAVSGASVALSGLGSRLVGLVDQLIMSYNISEKELEDVIYHNEAFSRSNSSIESSPVSSKHSLKDCTPSPKRGSFVSAVIGAIRNAATHPFATKQTNEKKSDSFKPIRKDFTTESSSDLLDFETEPCLMMENVLEDVPLPDTYSHNMVSSCDSLRRVLSVPEHVDEHCLRKTRMIGESSSLTNLTQAILHRRRVEDEEEENCESISESEVGPSEGPLQLTDYCPATSLVDQVIDVDNLVTKLLKVLRIIQLDNDTCIQELKDERAELETRLEILLAERKTVECSKEYEKDCLSNGVVDETIIIENGEHAMEEMNDTKELTEGDQAETSKCSFSDLRDEDSNANAAMLLSSRACS